jgi:hypothetical protein
VGEAVGEAVGGAVVRGDKSIRFVPDFPAILPPFKHCSATLHRYNFARGQFRAIVSGVQRVFGEGVSEGGWWGR